MAIEPENWSERWVLWAGKRSQHWSADPRVTLPVGLAIAFAMIGMLYCLAGDEPLLRWVVVFAAVLILALKLSTVLLWHERRTFYRIIEKLQDTHQDEDS